MPGFLPRRGGVTVAPALSVPGTLPTRSLGRATSVPGRGAGGAGVRTPGDGRTLSPGGRPPC